MRFDGVDDLVQNLDGSREGSGRDGWWFCVERDCPRQDTLRLEKSNNK